MKNDTSRKSMSSDKTERNKEENIENRTKQNNTQWTNDLEIRYLKIQEKRVKLRPEEINNKQRAESTGKI